MGLYNKKTLINQGISTIMISETVYIDSQNKHTRYHAHLLNWSSMEQGSYKIHGTACLCIKTIAFK